MVTLKRYLASVALLVVLAVGGWVSATSLVKLSHRAKVSDQAVWVARVWDERLSIEAICKLASERAGYSVPAEKWSKGSEGWLAVGPVVGKAQVGIRPDLSIAWIALE